MNSIDYQVFINKIWAEGHKLYRDLPWRSITDAYAVLVSEVMLQQTQVARVERFWPRFMALFPTLDALASAGTADVLEAWQGLGYNRRALALKRCAEQCSAQYAGFLPREEKELLALPGIGPATAAGVRAFAYNLPGIYLETNVRTVFLHEFFPSKEGISDKQLEPYILATCSQENPRAWYYALLDYGAYLKKTLSNPSRRSAHHTKQSSFEGSRRQKRAEMLRIVLAKPNISRIDLQTQLNAFEHAHGRAQVPTKDFESILADLICEGFFTERS